MGLRFGIRRLTALVTTIGLFTTLLFIGVPFYVGDATAIISYDNGQQQQQRQESRHHRYLLMATAGGNGNNGRGDSAAVAAPLAQTRSNATKISSNNNSNQSSASSNTTSRQLPRLLIIGVRKGGTRALLEMLHLHPQIAMVPFEVHFFDKTERYRRGLDWYREQMPTSDENQLTVEKSPSYYVTPEVPERVYAMNPHVQLVLIVRDPVTRLLSDFVQIETSRAAQGLANRTFQDVALLPDGRVNTQNRALHVSLYAKFLQRWLHVFPRRQLHIVDGDRLIRDPFAEVQLVERFLGLPPMIRRDQFYFNATKGFYCLEQEQRHQKCLAGSKGRKHPQVPEEVLSVLRQFFAPHNRKFFAMVGQEFDWPEQ